MPTEQRLKHSRGSDSGSEFSADSPGRARAYISSLEEPPTPSASLDVKAKKRKAHFEDDPVHEPLSLSIPNHRAYSATSPISQYCICPPEPHIPRPRNAFILYRSAQAADITAKDPRVSNPEQSKIIAKEWNSLSEKEKEPWKDLAEQEKIHHQQRYPNYRYQPKRSRRSSNLDSPLCDRSDTCARCGGSTMLGPTTPSNSHASRPFLPPVHTIVPEHRLIPHMNISSIATPDHLRRNGRSAPPAFVVPQYSEDEHYAHYESPDAKRRRFTGGGYAAVPGRSQVGTPYSAHSPYSNDSASDRQQRWMAQTPQSGSMPPPPPRSSLVHPGAGRDADPTLPMIQALLKSGRPYNVIIMELPWTNKLKDHNKVSPALKFQAPIKPEFGSPSPSRGYIIAMEGDNDAAVAKLGEYIEKQLKGDPKHAVIVERGPPGPPIDGPATIADYVALVHGWHQKSVRMVKWVNSAPPAASAQAQKSIRASKEEDYDLISPTNTARPNLALRATSPAISEPKPTAESKPAFQPSKLNESSTENDQSPHKPILLLHRYLYSTTNQWACRVPIADGYDPLEHWQWFVTMWRGIPGADLTVFVKDYPPEELGKDGARTVEFNQELRTVIVRRDRSQHSVGLEESTFRRVGFEVDEWIRGMARTVAAPKRASLV